MRLRQRDMERSTVYYSRYEMMMTDYESMMKNQNVVIRLRSVLSKQKSSGRQQRREDNERRLGRAPWIGNVPRLAGD